MTKEEDFVVFKTQIMKLTEKQLLQCLLIEKYIGDVTNVGKLAHKRMMRVTELVEEFLKDELVR